jgi:U3 small nucleolar RNA-associated protein 22
LHGPEPSDPKAVAFKEIWGEKSELRKFKDGSINLCVVSSFSNFFEKSAMVTNLVSYLINSHFGTSEAIQTKTLENILGTISYSDIQSSFTELKKVLKALELPLEVETIHALSPSLRYTSVKSPKSEKNEILMEFERSMRWPDDLNAILEMKVALCVRIATKLEEHNLSASVVVDSKDTGVEIFYNGFKFMMYLQCEREAILLKGTKDEVGYNLKHVITPILGSRISNACIESPYVSYVIRLVKRWLQAHMMSFIHDLYIEELVLAILSQDKYDGVASIHSGFIRVLEYLSSSTWESPLVLNFSTDDMHEREETEKMVNDHFSMSRVKGIKHMYVGSPHDPGCDLFEAGNSGVLAKRIKKLASASLALIKKNNYVVLFMFFLIIFRMRS